MTSRSAFAAGYLLFDLSERLLLEGRMFEVIFSYIFTFTVPSPGIVISEFQGS